MNQANSSLLNINNAVQLPVNVHKFGGSSLANAECLLRVIQILKQEAQLDDVVVVSANGKTTDKLFAIINCQQSEQRQLLLTELQNQQQNLVCELLSTSAAATECQQIAKDITKLAETDFDDIYQRHDLLAHGEIWSMRLLSALINEQLCPCIGVDSRQVLHLDCDNDYQLVEHSSQQAFLTAKQAEKLTVITGYIATDSKNRTQTLGRNGSDYSATIVAKLIGAESVTLWTDVDGIYSADPRIISTARKLHRIENSVAAELGRLGNPVLHAKTLTPLQCQQIQLNVASSFLPEDNGTEIGVFGDIAKSELSVTHNNDLVKINTNKVSELYLRHVIARFEPIYQCPDKSCLVVSQQFSQLAIEYLQQHQLEFSYQQVSLVAVVGYQVASRSEIKARFKRVLRHEALDALVGSDNGHSLLAFLNESCNVELLNQVHSSITKNARNIGLVVAGLGNIGSKFLDMLPKQLTRISSLENVHLVGLATSKKALINNDGIDPSQALPSFADGSVDYDNQQLLGWLEQHPYDELVVVDITPSESFAQLYQSFFERGIHVISANKCAGSCEQSQYSQLLDVQKDTGSQWLVNTTVGAGLPVNYAINDLLQSGDNIHEIAGIFSGTLSWLFANFSGEQAFSDLVLNALEQGFTEPDPRDDLSGLDVQRKLLILARLAGFELELDNIEVENLVPPSLQRIDKNEFFTRITELDEYFANKLNEAKSQQQHLRYVARFAIDNNNLTAKVGLEILPADHAFVNLTACDNIFLLVSDWYQENPLIIRGPGAGRDVTAGGLHSDLVNLCQRLEHKKKEVVIKGIY
ncbi:bifunctional aspartate kinase/homoserine dehydrogenase II [Thalassotalea sp. Y01]|uniref:bifunctional aspartate kinase/homoserine dehydrogenase II n=1 Tax=Thalassotalea sp. Y01 TaxID=2729613 RepID=UPI00145FC2F4|nr:bifunctional aspartate kinase/homoserine dehydrogenase II [Thalassotalea sp. Y01]NMP17037.1 bifunctional aspartate kinase/homoserine dehydrogenase II [Thalassotalea sp. Y01]